MADFLAALKNLTPPPDEIIFCFDTDAEFEWDTLEGVTVKLSQSLAHRGSLDRICAAREILRKYFINSGYQQALWVEIGRAHV